MAAKIALNELPGWPAAMTQQLAAAYCGISVDTFAAACPVLPVVITTSNAGKRYLRVRLDEWLLSLEGSGAKTTIGEVLRAKGRRQGMGAMWDENVNGAGTTQKRGPNVETVLHGEIAPDGTLKIASRPYHRRGKGSSK